MSILYSQGLPLHGIPGGLIWIPVFASAKYCWSDCLGDHYTSKLDVRDTGYMLEFGSRTFHIEREWSIKWTIRGQIRHFFGLIKSLNLF